MAHSRYHGKDIEFATHACRKIFVFGKNLYVFGRRKGQGQGFCENKESSKIASPRDPPLVRIPGTAYRLCALKF